MLVYHKDSMVVSIIGKVKTEDSNGLNVVSKSVSKLFALSIKAFRRTLRSLSESLKFTGSAIALNAIGISVALTSSVNNLSNNSRCAAI